MQRLQENYVFRMQWLLLIRHTFTFIMEPLTEKHRNTFIYHEKFKLTKCVCGKTLNNKHGICNSAGKFIEVKKCSPDACSICEKMNRKKLQNLTKTDISFWMQWDNRDGIVVCLFCRQKLTHETGHLPKDCDCDFFVDYDGRRKCNDCLKHIYYECNGFC